MLRSSRRRMRISFWAEDVGLEIDLQTALLEEQNEMAIAAIPVWS